MSLLKTEYAIVLNALLSAFTNRSDLRVMVRVGLGENLNAITSELNDLRVSILDLVEWADKAGRVEELVLAARESAPLNPTLRDAELIVLPALRARSKPKPPVALSPSEICLVGDNQPFVNRTKLRDYVEALGSTQGVRALLVSGPSFSGKTYSHQYLMYLGETTPDYHVARVDFRRLDLSVREWAELIADSLKMNKAGMPDRNDPVSNVNWIGRFSAWLANNIGEGYKWLVLDHIPAPGESTNAGEIRLLINALIEAAHNSKTTLRIVLLGYKPEEIAALPSEIVEQVRREEIAIVDQEELKQFFRKFFETTSKSFNESSVDAAVNQVVDQLDDGDFRNLKQLWPAVRHVTRALLAIEETP